MNPGLTHTVCKVSTELDCSDATKRVPKVSISRTYYYLIPTASHRVREALLDTGHEENTLPNVFSWTFSENAEWESTIINAMDQVAVGANKDSKFRPMGVLPCSSNFRLESVPSARTGTSDKSKPGSA